MSFSLILAFHICAGTIGLLSGAVAMSFRKGSRRHGLAGNVFVVSMLSMAASGAYVGFMKHQMVNFMVGILTFYLVTTAWLTGSRRDAETGIFDWLGLVVALAVGSGFLIYGVETASSPTRLKDGVPAPVYFIFGFVALLAAAGDVRMLMRGGVFGAHRIARHLWRMCVPLLIAANALFLGQSRHFPELLRKTNVLVLPSLVILILLIFWLFRVRFTNAYKRTSSVLRNVNVHSLRN